MRFVDIGVKKRKYGFFFLNINMDLISFISKFYAN